MKLILFEDTQEQADRLLASLRNHVQSNDAVLRFEVPAKDESAPVDARLYETRLRELLTTDVYKDADLVIADRDLSTTGTFTGLSEPTVKRVADELAIPECWYTRRLDEKSFVRAAEKRESCIAVSIGQGDDLFAQQILAIANGFAKIKESLPADLQSSERKSPGRTLAGVLGKPAYADKIALYASGDQNRLSAVLEMRDAGAADQKLLRLTCLLGYWLWDSVLRYPGVFVNEVAASSYLNIDQVQFQQDPAIKAVFQQALYSGPFGMARGQLWWRGMLDDIVAESGCADGREFASKCLNKEVPRSKCSEDEGQPAGYYCMLSETPVSLKNSRPGLPWFPRGADLARVSNSQYEELGPWL